MIKIGGIHKFSLIDFPSRISAVIFVQGCNLRCPYCHNRHLVLPEYFGYTIGIDEVFRFLESRKKMIEGIVISGGEPTIYEGIKDFIKKIKEFGYLVKLDTNGTNPEVLKELIEEKLVDYVAMDIKASAGKYEYISGSSISMDKIKKSIEILLQSDIEYEFRTTLIKDLLTYNDIIKIGQMIKGAKRYALQNFVSSENLINKEIKNKTGFSREEREKLKKRLKNYVKEIILR
ncbi:MAG TPA: anaerobic ribonucleoside-triphosphate reductase activating protein [Persephonella sp.]|uniref:Anaerobic ribonucleoside-triphosphate reductase activating protein n=1 Tax=Persephonella marina (strain DSM 14350 / EX-H1) TaxID=123214 RepID=C0QTS4_PERMH|nr:MULTISPECIES: anaerobic ribonucleoside-triphosphate reductase activating protein [Persephonella]ACO04497.1 anaerobic ribonucleoside-triphosphate reductase activating protein [Persephonella marina EX-H1]HCB70294.1 anaerobic ribonucleoside-triphosphate reductase activating protein [Persephonella sp.]